MKKKVKIIVLLLAVIGIIGFCLYDFVMFGGARNVKAEATDFSVTSASITSEFNSDLKKANQKYLEKAIEITGKITAVDGKDVILDREVICSFKDMEGSVKRGQIITVKCRLVGYDDLMGELRLDQCCCNKILN